MEGWEEGYMDKCYAYHIQKTTKGLIFTPYNKFSFLATLHYLVLFPPGEVLELICSGDVHCDHSLVNGVEGSVRRPSEHHTLKVDMDQYIPTLLATCRLNRPITYLN